MSVFLHGIFNRENSSGRLQTDYLNGQPTISLDEERNAGENLLIRKSGKMVHGMTAKNGHSAAVAPGTAIKWKTGLVGEEFEPCGAGDTCDGWVDPLATTSVAVGARGHIVWKGPVRKVLAGAETFAVDDLVKTGAAGVVTAAAAKTDAGYCGTVLVATTTNSDPVAILAELTDSVNQYTF